MSEAEHIVRNLLSVDYINSMYIAFLILYRNSKASHFISNRFGYALVHIMSEYNNY